jgi:small conductance mechanosensitive channel
MVAHAGLMPWSATAADDDLADACGSDATWLCEGAWNASHNRLTARLADDVLGPVIAAIVVVLVAALLSRYLRRLVTELITQLTRGDHLAGAALGRLGVVGADEERRRVRAETLSAVARTTVTTLVWVCAVLVILGRLSINLAPLIASAGVAGIALGLGAQSLVRDCISGFFILLEDQCGVGDEIDIGPAIGVVESITLRATTVRDDTGTLWTVPNGTVMRIGNRSRDWSQGTVDVTISNPAQLEAAMAVVERVASDVSALPGVAAVLVAPIATLGVASIDPGGPIVRLRVRTAPGEHLAVMRTLRAVLTRELDAAGIGSTAAG